MRFFAGISNVSVRLTGPNATARFNGEADFQNASISAFVGSERVSFQRVEGRILFTSNQAQIDNLTGFFGGGRFNASGGALLDGLELQAFRLDLRGNNVTVPLPKDFLTTGDAEIGINGRRIGGEMTTLISGRINARRSLYTKDIDLADVISSRGDGTLTQGSSRQFARHNAARSAGRRTRRARRPKQYRRSDGFDQFARDGRY